MTLNWVIGRGGLLGSALARGLGTSHQQEFISGKIRWGTTSALLDLRRELENFLERSGANEWQMYWCAGAGVTDSKPEDLKKESELVSSFLNLVASASKTSKSRGSFLFVRRLVRSTGGRTNRLLARIQFLNLWVSMENSNF